MFVAWLEIIFFENNIKKNTSTFGDWISKKTGPVRFINVLCLDTKFSLTLLFFSPVD